MQELIDCKQLAVVGVSRSGRKFGNMLFIELKKRGYEVYPVNPQAEEIKGERCYPDLNSLKGQVDGVVINVPPAPALQVVRDAAAAGIHNIWVQQGADSEEVVALGEELELNMVSGKCILMYAPPVKSIHRLHRTIWKWIGKL